MTTSRSRVLDASLSRRTVVAGAATTGAALALNPTQALAAEGKTGFLHGVASGDPTPTAVVIWTRFTPSADATPGSGRGVPTTVTWEVAKDSSFLDIIKTGTVRTNASSDHTVKVDVTGLKPRGQHFYRFKAGGVTSRAGRFKTTPAPGVDVEKVKLGVVSCSNWEAGYFSAYRHLSQAYDLDAILHLGDYIYEYQAGKYGTRGKSVRLTEPAHEIISLEDYRIRHAQYKTDEDLQALHARYPFITTWDDHEAANDSWSGGAQNHQPDEGSWAVRAQAARQAYDEWMPIRLSGTAVSGDGQQLYRELSFGGLADLRMMDLRSYRSAQVSPVGKVSDVGSKDRTMTGAEQMAWLKKSLRNSESTWKLMGNSVMFSPITFAAIDSQIAQRIYEMTGMVPPGGFPMNTDQWDGYQADQREIVDFLSNEGIANTVFLTGDIHSAWACEVPKNRGTYPLSKSIAVEFVCTSVTSDNLDDILRVAPRTISPGVEAALQLTNRHVRYLDYDRHGYSILTLTGARAQMDWYVLEDRTVRNSSAKWSAGWVSEAGTNRLKRVWGPAV